jgi:DNA-binding response OmpR family regulator
MGRVLIVTEDGDLAESLAAGLAVDKHQPVVARTIASARAARVRGVHDVLVLDQSLVGDALSLCEDLRRSGESLPIVVIAPPGSAAERIACLRASADDCLQRPLAMDEVRLRLQGLLRRARREARHAEHHRQSQEAGEHRVQLTSRECSLLACLVERATENLTPSELLSQRWSLTFNPRSGKLDVGPVGEHRQQSETRGHHSAVFERPQREGKARSGS